MTLALTLPSIWHSQYHVREDFRYMHNINAMLRDVRHSVSLVPFEPHDKIITTACLYVGVWPVRFSARQCFGSPDANVTLLTEISTRRSVSRRDVLD